MRRFIWLPLASRQAPWETFLSWRLYFPKFGTGICLLSLLRLLDYQCSKNLEHLRPFHCVPLKLQSPCENWPSRCVLMSWGSQAGHKDCALMSLQASFKYVVHAWKPTKAWRLPLLMPACVCQEESGTWTQSSNDRKYPSIPRYSSYCPPLPVFFIILILWPHNHRCYQIPVFHHCPYTSQELSSSLQLTFISF